MSRGVAITIRGLKKSYRKGGEEIRVLDGVDVQIAPGERIAIVGPSGCGKSTFLHLVGLLDLPTQGEVLLDDHDAAKLDEAARDRLRNEKIGFVFQAHHLLPEHSAVANVMMPLRLAGVPRADAEARASAVLRGVGLGHRLTHQPGELSGGEQQRVAIARSLVMGPGLVLADEPTGNLDPRTAASVFELFLELNQQLGSTLVVVTHSHELAARFPRRLVVADGRFVDA
jgi:lipoprotein-releasing system ATP-binding protein